MSEINLGYDPEHWTIVKDGQVHTLVADYRGDVVEVRRNAMHMLLERAGFTLEAGE